MAGASNIPNGPKSWDDPDYWALPGQQQQQATPPTPQPTVQQQAPAPQLVLGKVDPNNQMSRPVDQETLQRMIQQETVNTIGHMVNTNNQVQQASQYLRQQFLKSEKHRPWLPIAEVAYNQRLADGGTVEQARDFALKQCKALAGQGLDPTKMIQQNSHVPQIGGYNGMGQLSSLKPGESASAIGFYSDEQRMQDRQKWMKDRQKHYHFVKSGGSMGKHLRDSNPGAYDPDRFSDSLNS